MPNSLSFTFWRSARLAGQRGRSFPPSDTDRVGDLMLSLWPGAMLKDIQIGPIRYEKPHRSVVITMKKPFSTDMSLPQMVLATIAQCGGSRNDKYKRATEQYILRISRETAANLPREAATLAYALHHVTYTVPQVLVFDKSEANALGEAYMLQTKVPGTPLSDLWAQLNFEQKSCAAHCVSQILLDLHAHTHQCAGVIGRSNNSIDMARNVKLESLLHQKKPSLEDWNTPTIEKPQTTREFLLAACRYRREKEAESNEYSFFCPWHEIAEMVDKLYVAGLLPDDTHFHFHHGDLQPRNLFFEIVDESRVKVTGILSWGSAMFAPRFVSAQAPSYLWSNDISDESQVDGKNRERKALDAEKKAFKRVFEDVVGRDFCEYAYRREYVLLRRLFPFLMHGVQCRADERCAKEVLDELRTLYPAEEEQTGSMCK